MRILLVGASGLLGRAVAEALSTHEVIEASRSGKVVVDLNDADSITALYEGIGMVDAVACAAGVTPFASIGDLSLSQYHTGINDKLLGQIALVRLGLDHVRDGGSFTLISGVLAHDPIPTGSVAGTVNGGIEAFVRSAAIELPRALRINTVSPTVFTEAWDDYGGYFPGFARCMRRSRTGIRQVDRGRSDRPDLPRRLLTAASVYPKDQPDERRNPCTGCVAWQLGLEFCDATPCRCRLPTRGPQPAIGRRGWRSRDARGPACGASTMVPGERDAVVVGTGAPWVTADAFTGEKDCSDGRPQGPSWIFR